MKLTIIHDDTTYSCRCYLTFNGSNRKHRVSLRRAREIMLAEIARVHLIFHAK